MPLGRTATRTTAQGSRYGPRSSVAAGSGPIHRPDRVGEPGLQGDTERVVDRGPTQVSRHHQDPLARLCECRCEVRGDGGLAVARLGTGDEDGLGGGCPHRCRRSTAGADLDQAERVCGAGQRVGCRHDVLPASARDRRDLGEHREAERFLRRSAWIGSSCRTARAPARARSPPGARTARRGARVTCGSSAPGSRCAGLGRGSGSRAGVAG